MGHTVQLGRMVRVQKKLTALYETRLAAHKTAAAMAAAEADAIATRAARPGSLTGMHPELCQAAIAKALARHQDHLAEAEIARSGSPWRVPASASWRRPIARRCTAT